MYKSQQSPPTGDGRLEGTHNNNYLFIHHPPEHWMCVYMYFEWNTHSSLSLFSLHILIFRKDYREGGKGRRKESISHSGWVLLVRTSDSGIKSYTNGADRIVAFSCHFSSASGTVTIRVDQVITGHGIFIVIVDVIAGQRILMWQKKKESRIYTTWDLCFFSFDHWENRPTIGHSTTFFSLYFLKESFVFRT